MGPFTGSSVLQNWELVLSCVGVCLVFLTDIVDEWAKSRRKRVTKPGQKVAPRKSFKVNFVLLKWTLKVVGILITLAGIFLKASADHQADEKRLFEAKTRQNFIDKVLRDQNPMASFMKLSRGTNLKVEAAIPVDPKALSAHHRHGEQAKSVTSCYVCDVLASSFLSVVMRDKSRATRLELDWNNVLLSEKEQAISLTYEGFIRIPGRSEEDQSVLELVGKMIEFSIRYPATDLAKNSSSVFLNTELSYGNPGSRAFMLGYNAAVPSGQRDRRAALIEEPPKKSGEPTLLSSGKRPLRLATIQSRPVERDWIDIPPIH